MTQRRKPSSRKPLLKGRVKIRPLLTWVLMAGLSLQLVFAAQLAAYAWFTPRSTAFQRSEFVRLLVSPSVRFQWNHEVVSSDNLSKHLRSAVIASEDSEFATHWGFDMDALESAWKRNERAQERAEQSKRPPKRVKVVGGSTVTQQLAKNLFLSGERNLPRKAQELVITLMIETLWSKVHILDVYLNSVEWGEGVFGAQAAAQRLYRLDANRLGPWESARLVVMLPSPKRYAKLPNSPYLTNRAATIMARMNDVEVPR